MNAVLAMSPDAGELSDEDRARLEQARIEAEEEEAFALMEQQRILDSFGSALEDKKDEAVRWRAPIDQRMIEDLRQDQGEQPNLSEVKGQGAVPAGRERQGTDEFRATRDNITKPARKQIAARIKDMLFPTSERNWDLEPSPVPDLANPEEVLTDPATGQPFTMTGPDGQPKAVTAADVQARVKSLADQKCARMRQHVDDMLQECNYSKHGRAVIDDGCLYGTGVLTGPVIRRTRKRSYHKVTLPDGQVIPEIKVKERETAALEHLDVWMFYPQPCRCIEEAEHAFVLSLLTPKKVRELAKQPGFIPEQINRLLKLKPELGTLASGGALVERDRILTPDLETMTGRYPMWRYVGPIPRETMEAAGIPFDEEDELDVMEGEVWFCQGIVVKAVPFEESTERLPFYIWNYEKDPSCVFGFSVPHNLRNDQYAVNQTWHAVTLNAIMSSSAQIGVIPGMMEPVNGRTDLSCTKPKVWAFKSEVTDIRQVLSEWHPNNNTGPLMAVYERAKMNGMERLMLPQFQEGAPTMAAKTSSGLAMLMNSANIVQRDSAKSFDDGITTPALRATVDYYLLNGDDEDAKGDYNVIPKGESHLLIKDIQAQHVQIVTSLADSPRFAPYFEDYELLELNFKVLSMPTAGLLKDKQSVEEALKQQQGQPDAEMAKAMAAQAAAEASKARAESEAVRAQNEAERVRLEMRDRELERQANLLIAQANIQIQIAKMDGQEELNAQQIAAKREIAILHASMQEKIEASKTVLKAEEIVSKEAKVAQEIAVESPVRLA